MKKWKNMMLVAAGVLAVAIGFAGCGSNDKAAQQELPKKIVIGLDDNFPPMGFKDEKGNLVGFDIDMAKEAAKRANMEIEFRAIDWSSKEAELKGKKIDALWNGLSVSEERKKNILFSDAYISNGQILIVRADSNIQSQEDVQGKTLAVQEGSTAYEAVKSTGLDKKAKEVKQYADNVTALMDVEIGRADAIVVDSIVGRYMIAKKAETYRVLGKEITTEDMAVGFRKEDTKLQQKFNQILTDMKKDGTSGKISEKWFGKNIIK